MWHIPANAEKASLGRMKAAPEPPALVAEYSGTVIFVFRTVNFPLSAFRFPFSFFRQG